MRSGSNAAARARRPHLRSLFSRSACASAVARAAARAASVARRRLGGGGDARRLASATRRIAAS